ncbi:TetR/AcrR family transcriptional regulator [Eupransor demetentiae]|uniref:AcrR family n=1 Tax=Eupransor demetentiae TaxID=3109584 RepID=A0ABM9N6A2_9LACO|nr:AcrR family [Lactobacillaceae bacterium LMG 33000]
MVNKRAELMRSHILESFAKVLANTPFSKLTVKSICDEAEINRNTFYHHFKDKYDILDAVFHYGLAEFFKHTDLKEFTKHPFTTLAGIQDTEFLVVLHLQMKDPEFVKLFERSCMNYLFKISGDSDFLWLLGNVYVITLWNDNQHNPYDPMQDYKILDQIYTTHRFPPLR